MMWEWIVSRRFHRSKIKSANFLGVVSMLGMGIGCFAIIISVSVMNGFEAHVHNRLRGFDGDIRIYDADIFDILQKNRSISHIMPFMERKAVLESGKAKKVVLLKSVDQSTLPHFYKMSLRGLYPKQGQIMIGQDIAYRMGKGIGDEILVLSPVDQNIGLLSPSKKKFKISGVFSTKILNYDDTYAFITLTDGEKIFKRKNGIDGYDIRIRDKYSAQELKKDIENSVENKISLFTWEDQNKSLVDAMRIERYATIFVLCLIFLVASFNLSANLTLVSMQKIKDIAMLRMLGASKRSIYNILIQLGIMRAGKGALVGFLIGIFIVFVQQKFSFIKIPPDVYFIDTLPMKLYLKDILLITVISLFFIFLASFYSAKTLVKFDLKKALQWEK